MDWKASVYEAFDLLSHEGALQWFAKRGDDIRGGRIYSAEQLIGTVRNAEQLAFDLYINANPSHHRPGKTKLSRNDISLWRYVVVDIDPQGDIVGVPSSIFTLNGHIIYSGRGYQVWQPLDPIEGFAGEAYAFLAERAMSAYLRHLSTETDDWKIDTSCSDLARVVRCPGSINWKTGNRASIERTSSSYINRRNFLDFWRTYSYDAPPPPQHFPNLNAMIPHLNKTARKFVLEGAESPGRHHAAFATAKNLKEVGATKDQAHSWLAIGGNKCYRTAYVAGPETADVRRISYPICDRDIERIIKQVYGG